MASKNHVTIARKSDEPKARRQPAKNEQDWIDQEKVEPIREVFQDPISEALGDNFFIQHAGYEAWRHPRTGQRFTCSRFYVHRKVVVDFPNFDTEADAKREALKDIGIAYVGVLPGKPLIAKDLVNQVEDAVAELKVLPAMDKPTPAAKVVKPVKAKGKAKRALKAAAMILALVGAAFRLSAATTYVAGGQSDAQPRVIAGTHEPVMATYACDINGNSVSAGSPMPVSLTTASYGAYVAGGANALSNNAIAMVQVGGPTGQQTMANSAPVALASDQAAIPVSSATLATQATLSALSAKHPPSLGQQAIGSQLAIVDSVASFTQALNGLNNSLTFDVHGMGAFGFNISAIAGASAAIQAKVSTDGVLWQNVNSFNKQTNAWGGTQTGTGTYSIPCGDVNWVALSMTAGTAPTSTVSLYASRNPGLVASNTGGIPVNLFFGTNQAGTSSGSASGVSNFTGLNCVTENFLSNLTASGTMNDRQVTNVDTAVIPSAAFTTTQTSADQINYNGRGVKVWLDVTSAGTGSITLSIKGKDPASGKYITLLAGAAVVTAVTNVYTVYPGAPVTANVSANDILPRTWQIVVTANNANSMNYSVGASTIW